MRVSCQNSDFLCSAEKKKKKEKEEGKKKKKANEF